MAAFQDSMKALATMDKGKGTASSSSSGSSHSTPKISIMLPKYKGEPNKNVVVWLQLYMFPKYISGPELKQYKIF
jgi:hypothetical protein